MGGDPDITYRFAGAADIQTLVSMRAAFLAEVAGADAGDAKLLDALRRYFTHAVPAGQFIACLAECGGQTVATSGLLFDQHAPTPGNLTGVEPYILNMYTLPAYRGRGIAAVLLEKLIAVARERGHARVTLHAMPLARPVYEAAGFEPMTSEMRLTFDNGEPHRAAAREIPPR